MPTAEDAITLIKKNLKNKDYIFRTEYIGQPWQTMVSIYEDPSFLRDTNLATYMLKFDDIVSASHDKMRGEWRLNLMLDCKTFYSIPNWLDWKGTDCQLLFPAAKQPAGTAAKLVTSLLKEEIPEKAWPKPCHPPIW